VVMIGPVLNYGCLTKNIPHWPKAQSEPKAPKVGLFPDIQAVSAIRNLKRLVGHPLDMLRIVNILMGYIDL
jgi:hypothetical protein